ncbi:MAG: EboA domain-containing protein [Cyclobacteriaceae bacterium]
MDDLTYQETARQFLHQLISQQSAHEAGQWLMQQATQYQDNLRPRSFYLTFSTLARRFGKAELILNEEAVEEARQIRSGWDLSQWTLLQAARTYWLLQLSTDSFDAYRAVLDRLFETADMDEQRTLYASLPLLSYPKQLAYRASEGVRTNITSVFDAIALRNPYPAEYLEEAPWNQMVLKAIFMDRPLYLIQQLNERRNPAQARMLVDFAHERWAAHRPVTPELWRGVAPYLTEEHQDDIRRLLEKGTMLEQQAAVLASKESGSSALQKLIENQPPLPDNLRWDAIGQQHALQKTKTA